MSDSFQNFTIESLLVKSSSLKKNLEFIYSTFLQKVNINSNIFYLFVF